MGFLRADGVRLVVAVVFEPGVVFQLAGVVAERIGGGRAGAGRVFPLGLGRQAIVVARDAAEPLGVLPGGELRDRHGGLVRLVADAVGERRIVERRGRGHGVDVPLIFELAVPGVHLRRRANSRSSASPSPSPRFMTSSCSFLNASYIAMNDVVLGPGDFVLADPERLDFHADLRAFVVGAVGFARRAAHQKLAAGNGHHLERDVGAGNRLRVRNHVAAVDFHEAAVGRLLGDEAGNGWRGGAGSSADRTADRKQSAAATSSQAMVCRISMRVDRRDWINLIAVELHRSASIRSNGGTASVV